jgi:hypothetical protein
MCVGKWKINWINKLKNKLMKMKNLVALLTAFMLVALLQVTVAQTADTRSTPSTADNWVLLDSHVVDYTLDRDVVKFKDNTSIFMGLKFKVNNGPINLHKCTVNFSNGESQDVSFATDVNDGRLIDLNGNKRSIEKITIWYDTKNSAENKAVVEVWGKK